MIDFKSQYYDKLVFLLSKILHKYIRHVLEVFMNIDSVLFTSLKLDRFSHESMNEIFFYFDIFLLFVMSFYQII